MKKLHHIINVLGLILACHCASADVAIDVANLQTRWAEINYQLDGKAQLAGFEQLVTDAEKVTAEYPDQAEGWIWSGIIKSTYAGAKGGLDALSLAKAAKSEREKALEIDPAALSGSGYTSLGSLYYSVPGWPIGFGDNKKAEALLKQALAINPTGIDSNYFYGDYLIDQKRFDEARNYLQKARQAPSRPGRELADSGRQEEISQALASIAGK